MATYERELNIIQGFNFKKDVQLPIGFLTMLKVGTETFTQDMTVNSPMAATATASSATADVGALKVVAVLGKVTWEMGDTDALQFEGNLSIAGKQTFSALLYSAMIDIDIEIGFVVYEYDALAKKYFAAFSNSAQGDADASSTGVLGQIKKDNENLAMTIEMEPHDTVQSPINYKFTLQVVPKPKAQILKFATSSTRKVTKNWGRVGPT